MNGIQRIAAERQRQIEADPNGEGWTAEHDDGHDRAELISAAACYAALAQATQGPDCQSALNFCHDLWPWSAEWWKPSADPIRNLEKAGALIAAEIDRLQRKGAA